MTYIRQNAGSPGGVGSREWERRVDESLYDLDGPTGRVAALEASLSGRAAPYIGPKNLFFGDSIPGYKEPFPYYAMLFGDGKIEVAQLAFYPGETTTQLLARVDTVFAAAAAAGCTNVVSFAGSNDASVAATLATFKANIQALLVKARQYGLTLILCTVPPRVGQFARISTYNTWLARWAPANGVPLIDITTVLTDPATGNLLSAMSDGDGVHPSPAGAKAIGKAIADALKATVAGAPQLVLPAAGAPNLFTNSQFLTPNGSNPQGWGGWSGTGVTNSLVADPRGFNWHRATLLSAAAGIKASGGFALESGFAPGDRLRLAMMIRLLADVTSGVVSGEGRGLGVKATWYTAGYASSPGAELLTAPNGSAYAITRACEGIVSKEVVVPANAAILHMQILVGDGDGTYEVARPDGRNLTALGAL